jgi:hypothetical protein
MYEARYSAAQCRALLGNASGALKDLDVCIDHDPDYSTRAAADPDFDPIREDYRAFLAQKTAQLHRETERLFAEIKSEESRAEADGSMRYYMSFNAPRAQAEMNRVLADIERTLNKDVPYHAIREIKETCEAFLPRMRAGLQAQREYFETQAEKEAAKAADAAVRAATAAKKTRWYSNWTAECDFSHKHKAEEAAAKAADAAWWAAEQTKQIVAAKADAAQQAASAEKWAGEAKELAEAVRTDTTAAAMRAASQSAAKAAASAADAEQWRSESEKAKRNWLAAARAKRTKRAAGCIFRGIIIIGIPSGILRAMIVFFHVPAHIFIVPAHIFIRNAVLWSGPGSVLGIIISLIIGYKSKGGFGAGFGIGSKTGVIAGVILGIFIRASGVIREYGFLTAILCGIIGFILVGILGGIIGAFSKGAESNAG